MTIIVVVITIIIIIMGRECVFCGYSFSSAELVDINFLLEHIAKCVSAVSEQEDRKGFTLCSSCNASNQTRYLLTLTSFFSHPTHVSLLFYLTHDAGKMGVTRKRDISQINQVHQVMHLNKYVYLHTSPFVFVLYISSITQPHVIPYCHVPFLPLLLIFTLF